MVISWRRLSQLDLAGGILFAGRIVTVSVSALHQKTVSVGDVVCCYGECTRIGRTSMSIDLVKLSKKMASEIDLVCDATLTMLPLIATVTRP